MIISSILNIPIKVVSYNKMNRRDNVQVTKFNLQKSNGEMFSLFAKHLNYENGIYIREPDWYSEKLAYSFLSTIRNDFDLYPQLLGANDAFLLLEDLGDNDFLFKKEEEAQQALLDSLAKLHAASLGKKDTYLEMEKEINKLQIGYEIIEYDNLTDLFNQGMSYLQSFIDPCNNSRRIFSNIKQDVLQTVENPKFQAFIHNDYCGKNQSLDSNGQFYLFDFGFSIFSHALIDFWRLYIGKVRLKYTDGVYILQKFEWLPDVEQWYRSKLETYTGSRIDEMEWNQNICAVAIYLTICNVGKLRSMPLYLSQENLTLQPDIPFHSNLYISLKFLTGYLTKKKGIFDDFRRICDQHLQRTYRIV